MLKTNKGIIVKPRMTGHEMSLPLPKDIHIDKNSKYLIQSKDPNHIKVTRIKNSKENPFADFTPNLIKDHLKLESNGFYGVDKNKGREL